MWAQLWVITNSVIMMDKLNDSLRRMEDVKIDMCHNLMLCVHFECYWLLTTEFEILCLCDAVKSYDAYHDTWGELIMLWFMPL